MSTSVKQVTTLPQLAPRKADSHKGDFGRVLVIAGSKGMCGAAVLCGSAALRGGAGLVTVACPESCWSIVASGNPCLMTLPLPDGRNELQNVINEKIAAADVVVVGPGLGRSKEVVASVNHISLTVSVPVVIDADALNAFDRSTDIHGQHAGPRILTPHPGEFARLLGISTADVQSRREQLTVEFAKRFGLVLVLKGHETLVCDGDRIYRNTTGNPGMATAGSGDVLAGLIGALIGQGLAPFDAAQLGVFVHGRAGDLARDHFGEVSLIASDLLDYLPMAFQSIQDGRPKEGL